MFRIGELSRRVGVGTATLRAWERRYGLLDPERSPSGYRLYTDEDEARIRLVTALMRDGAVPVTKGRVGGDTPESIARSIRQALERFDEAEAQAEFDRAIATYGTDTVITDVVLPAVVALGKRWASGKSTVAQEHFATNVLRGRLMGLGRVWSFVSGPRAVLACPAKEHHDLALVAFWVALRGRGWRATMIGADTPTETLREAADRLKPAVIVVAATTPVPLAEVETELRELAAHYTVLIAGAAATPTAAQRTGTSLLPGGPVEAAEWIAGATDYKTQPYPLNPETPPQSRRARSSDAN